MTPSLPITPTEAHMRATSELAFAHCLAAAQRSGLIQLLCEADAPIADPAALLGLHPGAVERVLDVLEANGWLDRGEDGWQVAPWVALAFGFPLRMRCQLEMYEHLDDFLAQGTVAPAFEARTIRHTEGVVTALASMFSEVADDLARRLTPASGRVLDLGAGSAVWSLAQLALSDHAEVVALDRPDVLRATQTRAEQLGLADRLRLLPGDLFQTPLPRARRVILANVLHLMGPESCRRLVARAASALEPGGELVLIDVAPAEGRAQAQKLAGYALHLRLREAEGQVHSPQALEGWLDDAGLSDVVRHILPSHDLSLMAVVGTLPHTHTHTHTHTP